MKKPTIKNTLVIATIIFEYFMVFYSLYCFIWGYTQFEKTQKTIYQIHVTLEDGSRPSTIAVESATAFWIFLTSAVTKTVIYIKNKKINLTLSLLILVSAVTTSFARRGIHENLYGVSHSIKFNSWLPFYSWISFTAYAFMFITISSLYQKSDKKFNIYGNKYSVIYFVFVCMLGVIYGIIMILYSQYYIGDNSTPWVNNPVVHNRYLIDIRTGIWLGGEELSLKLYINDVLMIVWFVALGFFLMIVRSVQKSAKIWDLFMLSIIIITAVFVTVGLRINHQWRLYDAAKGFHTEWGSLKTAALCFAAVYFSFLLMAVACVIKELKKEVLI